MEPLSAAGNEAVAPLWGDQQFPGAEGDSGRGRKVTRGWQELAVGVCGWSRDGVRLRLLAGSPGVSMGTAGGCSEGSAGSAGAPRAGDPQVPGRDQPVPSAEGAIPPQPKPRAIRRNTAFDRQRKHKSRRAAPGKTRARQDPDQPPSWSIPESQTCPPCPAEPGAAAPGPEHSWGCVPVLGVAAWCALGDAGPGRIEAGMFV